ncbi:LacI family DNA-binding transcriptional regulator [Trinickia caryophylli]|uniref:Transcriptional regulator, LacI family n=1 Tax=Trinickia caryophylli TaxID=28094 RepID=A0A1X7D3C1_TRICW|nr:LacI family DNA-binding transcriptional regulator [Trinickia caryophylli]PMS12848.1 LacI family DNA-binding transcriptional regulator [Trinickia caryophylli]TRX15212.1 LacI family DNA-binding transcriptional regulator [Trinickia caryophylli]WQE15083.1 LacI family DNA-binding transcriptional regulator [Trinickia caryophylli]SMF07502.1 transcriptional regulator, LacI family [Trinickia caryophylli]
MSRWPAPPDAPEPVSRARRGTGRSVLGDVARRAGVSTATVSRVFNEPGKVSAEVQARVHEAARALNWIPNAAGRALASTRTHIVGAIIPTLDNHVFASQVAGMQAVMAAHGFTLLLGCSNYDPSQALTQVRAMLARGVEAVSVVGEAQPPELFELLENQGVPYVVTYAYRDASPRCCIGFDNRAAFGQLTSHLLELGHRDFAIIMQPSANNDRVEARLAGIQRSLAERGIAVRPSHRREGPATLRFGRESLRAIWQAPEPRPSAVICGNDNLALGALLEAEALGIRVPAELSITGFDDIELAREIRPALTTMWVDTRAIGERAASALLDMLGGQTAVPGFAVAAELRVRESTGPCRRASSAIDS